MQKRWANDAAIIGDFTVTITTLLPVSVDLSIMPSVKQK